MSNNHNQKQVNNSPINDIKEIIADSAKQKSDEIKHKVLDIQESMQESIQEYIKKHPWKTIGFSALAGALLLKILQ